jgi:Tfp pilus assembly protein PilN
MTGINLLPPELKEERKKAQFNFRVATVCFSLLFILILGLIGLESANQILALSLKTNQTQIQFEEQEIAKLKDIDQKAKKINDILNLVDNLAKNQVLWSKTLKEIAACTPSGIQINGLTVNSKNQPNLDLSGIATSRREIAKFQVKLEESSLLKNVSFVSSDQTTTPKGTAFNFKLKAEFENLK